MLEFKSSHYSFATVVLTGQIPFKGYYIQARTLDGTPVGSFTPNPDPAVVTKVHSCGNGVNVCLYLLVICDDVFCIFD